MKSKHLIGVFTLVFLLCSSLLGNAERKWTELSIQSSDEEVYATLNFSSNVSCHGFFSLEERYSGGSWYKVETILIGNGNAFQLDFSYDFKENYRYRIKAELTAHKDFDVVYSNEAFFPKDALSFSISKIW